ncbi:MAG: TSUP family transporter, partial [Shimia sp.]
MPDIAVLIGAAILAGLVRGFSGFGTSMVFLPLAAQVLDPISAIVVLLVMDLFGPVPMLPRAWRDGTPREPITMIAAAALTAPVGLWALTLMGAEGFRWGVSLITLTLLACLIGGLRYTGPMSRPLLIGTGGAAGFLGGVAGLPGPPVILLYVASQAKAAVIRANTMLFLWLSDVLLLTIFAGAGRLTIEALTLGAIVILPYMGAGLIGQRLFDPARAVLYRRVAYGIIAISALQGLPIWE